MSGVKAAQMRKNSAPDKQHTRGHWHRRVSAQCLPLDSSASSPTRSLRSVAGAAASGGITLVVMQIRFFLHWSYQE